MAEGLVDSRHYGGRAQWLPELGWAGLGVGEAVYTSQEEAAMTEVLRRWPRESEALEASGRFCGQLTLSVAGLHPCYNLQNQSLCTKPSAWGWNCGPAL